MRREMLGVLDEIEADPTARVVILTGAGGHFCSGGDVKTMRTRHTAAEGRGRVELLNRLVLRLVRDRKSTRLNSSHGYISYAVFCLKKKNIKKNDVATRATTAPSAHMF